MSVRSLALAAALLAAALAGCASPPVDPAPEPAADPRIEITTRPDPTYGDVRTGPLAEPNVTLGLDRPPALRVGEWWRYRFESPLTGESHEFVRVLAQVDGDVYVFGMPHEGWFKEVMVYHTPGFGELSRADLSYFTHNKHFQPLRFPLVDGDSWTTEFSGSPLLTATVSVASPHEATVTFVNPSGSEVMVLVYDARIHDIREFRHVSARYEVVEHGTGFEGWVTIPRGEELVFYHGRIAGALAPGQPPKPAVPPSPLEDVSVAGGFNRVSFFQMAANTAVDGAGLARQLARAPDGTEFVTEKLPGGEGPVFQFWEHANPDGLWQFEHVALGTGVAFIEGIAYHQYDVRLPDGLIRSDHSHAVIR